MSGIDWNQLLWACVVLLATKMLASAIASLGDFTKLWAETATVTATIAKEGAIESSTLAREAAVLSAKEVSAPMGEAIEMLRHCKCVRFGNAVAALL